MTGRKSLFRRAMKNDKKNKAAWVVTTAVAVATAIIVFARGPCGVMVEPPIRGDRICAASEQWPYRQDATGAEMKDGRGNRIPNEFYSLEDCGYGDNICNDDPNNVRNAAGEPADTSKLLKKFRDGTPVNVVESAGPDAMNFSPDCARRDYNSEEPVTRPRFTGSRRLIYERQLTPEEQVERSKNPGELKPGDRIKNVTISVLDERCDPNNLPQCAPLVDEPCHFANHTNCEGPPHCGNGLAEPDKGEDCDPGSKKGRRKCGPKKVCASSCKCVPRRGCGDGTVDKGEQCDPGSEDGRSRCDPDERCNRKCKCVPKGGEVVCGDGDVAEGIEECDPGSEEGKSVCDPDERCNRKCKCEPKPQQALPECGMEGAGPLISRIVSQVSRKAAALRKALGCSGQLIEVTIKATIKDGIPKFSSASATCNEKAPPIGLSSEDIKETTGLNFGGISLGRRKACELTVKAPVEPR